MIKRNLMIKVYNLIENLDDTYGGPAKSVPYLCKNLNDLDVDTEMLSIEYHESEVNSVVRQYNLKWKSFKYSFLQKLRYSRSLKEYLDVEIVGKFNLILHTHNLWNYIPYLAYTMSKKHNLPLIVAIRGSLYTWSLEQRKLQKRIAWVLFQKRVLQNASCIHVTEVKEMEAVRGLGINTPIAIVPNGIDLQEFEKMKNKMDAKQSLDLNMEKKYILFMSRLHPKKGLEYLVNTWVKTANQYREWDLLIVGPQEDKKYMDRIVDIIDSYSLKDRVTFTGMLTGEHRIDAFGASDLFVLPSHTENFGIVIAEAMAAKLPVITTQGTPWKEIEENNAGWWVELTQENIDTSLNDAMRLNDDELKQKGLNGFGLIQNYEWKYQAQKMKKLYEYILYSTEKPDFVYEVKR